MRFRPLPPPEASHLQEKPKGTPPEYVGQTFTLKIKVKDSAGGLHELSHGYPMVQA